MCAMRTRDQAWLLTALLAGCSTNPERPAQSSAGCVKSVIDRELPSHLEDKLAHCVAGGLIARYCSPTEARLAGVAKEIRDLFTGGDVELADAQATFAGVQCAQAASDLATLEACCATACRTCANAAHAAHRHRGSGD
jgi:hypothetical protein